VEGTLHSLKTEVCGCLRMNAQASHPHQFSQNHSLHFAAEVYRALGDNTPSRSELWRYRRVAKLLEMSTLIRSLRMFLSSPQTHLPDMFDNLNASSLHTRKVSQTMMLSKQSMCALVEEVAFDITHPYSD
jgi:hypothetical protein